MAEQISSDFATVKRKSYSSWELDHLNGNAFFTAWQRKAAHARNMTWDELRCRLSQALQKRIDLARYVSGLAAKPACGQSCSPRAAAFFFSRDQLPAIVAWMRTNLPLAVEQIVSDADAICQHRFRLLGHPRIDYGSEIDWHLDAVHGIRASRHPWFKVPFLSFSEVGDHKVTWELNRHQHLVVLAKAWALTHEPKYAAEAIRQWYSWRSSNPYPIGINWASSLEVSFRSLSWLWMQSLLVEYSGAPAGFDHDLLQGLSLNATHIRNYLSTYFSPNTHLLGEAVGLFFIGTLCPQLLSAGQWRNSGCQIVLNEVTRQVRPDGVYFEQSLYYHVYALDFLLHFRLLAQKNQVEIPEQFDIVLNKMLDVVQRLSQAGPAEGFGDDDGGRFFDPARNRPEHMADPLAVGAILFQRDDLQQQAALTEEALWLFGPEAAACLCQPDQQLPLRRAAFKEGGIYVLANSEPCRQHLVMDAGPLGAGRAGHGHADALNITSSLDGRPFLIDSGTFGYSGPGNQRDRFRGTSAHNTLCVDGLDQAETDGPFAWKTPPDVRADRCCVGDTFSLLSASHDGYTRLPDPVLHRRIVFHLYGSFFFVRDLAEGRHQHRLEISWHFAPDLRVEQHDYSLLASAIDHAPDSARLVLLCQQGAEWHHQLEWCEVSRAYGSKERTQVLRTSVVARLPIEHATVIAPMVGQFDPLGTLAGLDCILSDDTAGVCGYRYETREMVHTMIFSHVQKRWTLDSWEGDAEFLYCGLRQGEVVHIIVCNGSFVKLNGANLFRHSSRVERFECVRKADKTRVFTSDADAVAALSSRACEVCVS